jgi:glyoxylase-like metal-dependent hydrolase (beta-lactamase superfamily II)
VEVAELRPGLWRWTAPHPDWTPDEGGEDGWEREVACLYLEAPDAIVLIDPLVPEGAERERFLRHLDADVERVGLPVAIVLTVFWHERSAPELRERYEAAVWAPQDAVEKLGVTVDHPYREGEALPGGLDAFRTLRADEVALWLPEQRALVFADAVLGTGAGGLRVCPDSWLTIDPDEFRAELRRLLELPAELVLTAHGEPVLASGRAALERALS